MLNRDGRFDIELRKAGPGEVVFDKLLHMKEFEKIEHKEDRLYHKWGNVFVEYESRGKPSGIATTESDYWTVYLPTTHGHARIIVDTAWVRARYLSRKENNEEGVSGGDDGTSTGYLFKLEELIGKP